IGGGARGRTGECRVLLATTDAAKGTVKPFATASGARPVDCAGTQVPPMSRARQIGQFVSSFRLLCAGTPAVPGASAPCVPPRNSRKEDDGPKALAWT